MKRKILGGVVTLLSVVVLGACTQNSGKAIVSMKSGEITQDEFYQQVKNSPQAQNVLLQLALEKVYTPEYGDKVKKADIDKKYQEAASQYGSQFESVLQQSGLTVDGYKTQLKLDAMIEESVREYAEKHVTDKELEELFKTYMPNVKAQVMMLNDEAKAKEALEKAKADGADFGALVKEYSAASTEQNATGDVEFNSGTTDVPDQVKEAASKLSANQVSDLVTVSDATYGGKVYYIVKVLSKEEKPKTWKDVRKELMKLYVDEKKADSTYVQNIVAEHLQKANIKVKDQAFSQLFAQYSKAVNTSGSSSTSGSSGSSGASSSGSSSK